MEKKGALWQEKAKEMDVEVALLKTWFESMRTRFDKLMNSKSRDAAVQHMERDEWILAKFVFLQTDIVRLRGR